MRGKVIFAVVVSTIALFIAGCGMARLQPEQAEMKIVERPPMEAPEPPMEVQEEASAYTAASDFTVERLVIRNAYLDLVVPDTETALDEINNLVAELEGYIVESNVYQYQEGKQAHVTLRVPAESLNLALERIRSLATEVRSERISGQDVTEEYVDLNSRLRHLEATEKRLLEFLEKAEDTEAALDVYEQLREVEGEIEQVKGRIQYLEQSAAMATISLDITPDALAQPIQVGGWHPVGTLRNALQALIRVLQFLVDAAIVIIVLVIPVVVIVAAPFVGLFYLVRAFIRRRRARKAGA